MLVEIDRPNQKQDQFLKAKTRFIAYGGARGGGKSWAVRTKAMLLAVNYNGIRILILRRTFAELRENHILPLMMLLNGVAIYKETDKSFTFPNRSRIKFGYCDSEKDVLQYQGQEYDIIFIDEATQFTEFQYNTLTACLRGANSFPKRFYLTCNPGGVGHEWVKRLFITMEYRETESAEEYTFIQAKVYDNKVLMETDAGYVNMLENLPEDLKRAWLEGDWNVFAGQYFKEFRDEIHVVDPFDIPKHWRRYFTMDYGLDMLAGYFVAVDERRNAYVYKEIYKSDVIISDVVTMIKNMTLPEEDIYAYLAPPDMWSRGQETGKSKADQFAEKGLYFMKSSNDREAGWLAMKEWLKPIDAEDGTKTARLKIFRNCRNLIRSIPALQYDERRPSDVATEPHEFTHACLTGNTIVHTVDGDIFIKDLVGKEGLVKCFDENSKSSVLSRFSNVTKTKENAVVIEIILEDDSVIKCTPDHPILTADGWKMAGELDEFDDVIRIEV